jgi:hypothetical protein
MPFPVSSRLAGVLPRTDTLPLIGRHARSARDARRTEANRGLLLKHAPALSGVYMPESRRIRRTLRGDYRWTLTVTSKNRLVKYTERGFADSVASAQRTMWDKSRADRALISAEVLRSMKEGIARNQVLRQQALRDKAIRDEAARAQAAHEGSVREREAWNDYLRRQADGDK